MIVTVSYTELHAGGGVPRFNRDIHSTFPGSRHYSWWDVAIAFHLDPNSQHIPEWEKARILSQWLLKTGRVTEQDVVIADSFWASGLEHLPYCISHQHGNWSHTTLEDVQRGVPPEFPMHAAAQLAFRKSYVKAGRKLTAVSDFIADQMRLQWGFDSKVIDNGIDTEQFRPARRKIPRKRPIVVHFVTTANKGFDHIQAVKDSVDADVWLLDEAAEKLNLPKYEALAQADVVVHPSAHEGNSYAVLESLACGVPIVTYNVGLMYKTCRPGNEPMLGSVIMNRRMRSPECTAEGVRHILDPSRDLKWDAEMARAYAELFSIENFRKKWREHVDDLISGR